MFIAQQQKRTGFWRGDVYTSLYQLGWGAWKEDDYSSRRIFHKILEIRGGYF